MTDVNHFNNLALRGMAPVFGAVVGLFSIGVLSPSSSPAQNAPGDQPVPEEAPASEDRQQAPAPERGSVEATLEQSLDAPDTPRVGDPLRLHVDVEHPADTSVVVDESFRNTRWKLLRTQRETTGDGPLQTSLTFTFQVFRAGTATLHPFPIRIDADSGEALGTLMTESVSVDVESALPTADDAASDGAQPTLRGTRPTLDIWVEDYTLAWVGGGVLGAALLGLLGVVVARRREDDEAYEFAPSRPADEVALEKLEALRDDELLEREEYMLFYVRMSETVRRYLGRRFGFPGAEMTTYEILQRLRDIDWPEALDQEKVEAWMRHVDLVKFSGMIPSRGEAHERLDEAFEFVEETRPEKTSDDETSNDASSDDGDAGEEASDEEASDDARWQPKESSDADAIEDDEEVSNV